MPELIHFSDPAPEASEDFPSPDRAIGRPPRRLTAERYLAENGALSIGEWRCEPGAWRIRFHARRHEYFHVLGGLLEIRDAAGLGRRFGPGDAGVIPAGFVGEFEVIEAVHKHYVMFDAP